MCAASVDFKFPTGSYGGEQVSPSEASPRSKKIDDLKSTMQDFGTDLLSKVSDTLNNHPVFKDMERKVKQFKEQEDQLKKNLDEVQNQLHEALQHQEDLRNQVQEKTDAMKGFLKAFMDAKKNLNATKEENQKQSELLNNLQLKIQEQGAKIKDRDAENLSVLQQNQALEAHIVVLKKEKGEWEAIVGHQKQALKDKDEHMGVQAKQILGLEDKVQENEVEMAQIQKQVQEMKTKSSTKTVKKTSRIAIALLIVAGLVLSSAFAFYLFPGVLAKTWSILTFSSAMAVL